MTRILITGAGGAAAVSLLRNLGSVPDLDLLTGDIDPLAAGLYLVPASRRMLLPRGDAPDFADAMLRICQLHGVDVLIPTVDVELLSLSRRRGEFESVGTALLLAPETALEICLDKAQLMERAAEHVFVPRTQVLGPDTDTDTWPLPCIVKPRSGAGGRGFKLLRAQVDWDGLPRDESLIIQDYLPGEEYSVDVLTDADGAVLAAVPRARMKVDSGVAVAARTLHDTTLESMSARIVEVLDLRFVANVQWRRDADGTPRLLEINPRFPGTMPLTVAAGVDMPKLAVQAATGIPTPPQPRHAEVALVRHWEERVVSLSEFTVVDHGDQSMVA